MSPLPLTYPPEAVYFAQPYSIAAEGFYFSTLEEYEARAAGHTDRYGMPVEEYEIQFIDGDNSRLFNALNVNQATLSLWFETFAELDPDNDDYLKAVYLAENGYAMADIPDRLDDLTVWHGTAEEYAQELVEDCYELPETLRYYVDYAAVARDMRLNGEIDEVEIDGETVLVMGY